MVPANGQGLPKRSEMIRKNMMKVVKTPSSRALQRSLRYGSRQPRAERCNDDWQNSEDEGISSVPASK